MQQPMTFNIEQSIHSIRSGLRRRHAISRLNRGLARFTETELEDLLSKADIRRSELFTGFKGNAVHRQLMGRMLAHLGVDHAQASEHCWIDLIYAESVCARCCNRRRCRRCLKSGRKNGAPTVFCPNAELFYQTRLALAARVEVAWKGVRDLEEKAFWRQLKTEWLGFHKRPRRSGGGLPITSISIPSRRNSAKLSGNCEPLQETRRIRSFALIGDDPVAPDPNAQVLEDVACVVFLAHYLADFAEKHDSNKVVEILLKT
jgi:hypothetical protein